MASPVRRLAVLVCLAALAGPSTAAANSPPLRLGFFDGVFTMPNAGPWLDRAAGHERADVARILISWASIAPRPPAHPTDWRDPHYEWRRVDSAIKKARAHGLSVLGSVVSVPAWAEGPRRPRDAAPGTWRPRARALGRFMRAVSARYSGRVRGLPRVDAWQILNEPNLGLYLRPQWVRRGGRLRPASPAIYRGLLNASYAGVKAGNPRALVVAAGCSPFGDPPGRSRMRPVLFWRELLKKRVRLDVAAHHPYSYYGPFHSASNADDAAVPDLGRIQKLLRTATARRLLLPRAHKRFWVTEISWDSRPPDSHGVPVQRHARRLEGTLYKLWSEGVDTVLWFQIRDDPGPDYRATFQSGTYTYFGRPKPAAEAFRFPFVAVPSAGRGRVRLWTRPPVGGRMLLERRRGAGWITVGSAQSRPRRVFTRLIRGRRGQVYRARIGRERSLAWTVGSAP